MKLKIFKTIKKPKLYAFGLASVISITSLCGCADKTMGEVLHLENQEMNTMQPENTNDKEIETKTFNPGEHIIAKSYWFDTNISTNSGQFSYHPGYIIIDIEQVDSVVTFFYQNEKTVECTSNENGGFLEFGTPIEEEKTLTLK